MKSSGTAARTRTRRKILAVASGGVAIGLAAVVSLAAWTDIEWVFGGTGGADDPGVGTSTFDVHQNAWSGTTAPAPASITADFETNPGDNLTFNVDPGSLTPGDTIYAPVALSTDAASIAGTLVLQQPVTATGKLPVDAGGLLWDNLTYSVAVTGSATTAANCKTDFATAGTVIVTDAGLSDALTPGAQALLAANGDAQYYCFAITLPDNATTQGLQGRNVYPAWRFAATSS